MEIPGIWTGALCVLLSQHIDVTAWGEKGGRGRFMRAVGWHLPWCVMLFLFTALSLLQPVRAEHILCRGLWSSCGGWWWWSAHLIIPQLTLGLRLGWPRKRPVVSPPLPLNIQIPHLGSLSFSRPVVLVIFPQIPCLSYLPIKLLHHPDLGYVGRMNLFYVRP